MDCTCGPAPGQLTLFDLGHYFVAGLSRPFAGQYSSSAYGKIGFDRDATRDVFRWRRGDGPLIACPDTDVLIWLVDEISRMEEGIGIVNAPLLRGNWSDPVEAVRDILHLWQFRDIRFRVSDHYLVDGKLTEPRARIRERVQHELAIDFAMRGGFDDEYDDETDARSFERLAVRDEFDRLLPGCPVHLRQTPRHVGSPGKWPHSKDRPLLADALREECDVFLTFDKGVLACTEAFAPYGLTILSPTELLERLDRDGQLDVVPEWPVDLDAIARFYGIAVEIEDAA